MAHQLRALAALPKVLGSIPINHVPPLTTVSNSSGRRSGTLTQTHLQAEHKVLASCQPQVPVQPRWRPGCFAEGA